MSQNPYVDPWRSPTVDAAAVVLVGVDGSENSWYAVSWACGEARRLRGRAVAVFVSSSAESGLAASALIGAALFDFDRNDGRADTLRRELGCYAADHEVDLSFVHIDGDVASELLRLATELHADQIVVGRSMKARHRLAASVGRRLVGTREAPVVVVVPLAEPGPPGHPTAADGGWPTLRGHATTVTAVTAFSDLSHQGDADLVPGLVDLSVNARSGGTPAWLDRLIRESDIAAYPDHGTAVAAVAARHRRGPGEVLLTAGAAEAFVLLARTLRPRHAVVVHPQFTEPEAALRAAGHQVDQVILPFPFAFDPGLVPADADLVFIGNPTNPTSVAHSREALAELVRPGRLVVVDEAFADCLPGERESLASRPDLEGLVVVRSLTKTWALAGLRVGYVLASADVVALLAAAQPLWPVSTPALAACVATATDRALSEVAQWAATLGQQRAYLLRLLGGIDKARVVPDASASFVLLDTPLADLRSRLQGAGFAVRRGETFAGLGPGWIRIAVRDAETSERFAAALREVVEVDHPS